MPTIHVGRLAPKKTSRLDQALRIALDPSIPVRLPIEGRGKLHSPADHRGWKAAPSAPASRREQRGASPLPGGARSWKSKVTAPPRGGVGSNRRRTCGPQETNTIRPGVATSLLGKGEVQTGAEGGRSAKSAHRRTGFGSPSRWASSREAMMGRVRWLVAERKEARAM